MVSGCRSDRGAALHEDRVCEGRTGFQQDAEKVRQRRSHFAQRLNVEESHSEVGNTGGTYPFTKIHLKGERRTRSAVRTSSPLRPLRPRRTAFLSILRVILTPSP